MLCCEKSEICGKNGARNEVPQLGPQQLQVVFTDTFFSYWSFLQEVASFRGYAFRLKNENIPYYGILFFLVSSTDPCSAISSFEVLDHSATEPPTARNVE